MNRKDGFTLVELLLALALGLMVVAVVGTALFTLQRSTMASRILNQQQEAMARTLQQIRAQVQEAKALSLADMISINPALVKVSLPAPAPGQTSREFKFGYQQTGGYVWVGEPQRPACPHVELMRLQYDADKHLLLIRLQSQATINGYKQGLPLILETSVFLRNAGP